MKALTSKRIVTRQPYAIDGRIINAQLTLNERSFTLTVFNNSAEKINYA